MRTNRLTIHRWVFLATTCVFFHSFVEAQSAKFATAGTGTLKNYISWFDWAGISIVDNSTVSFSTEDGLRVNVRISNVTGPAVVPYVMNTWSGAVLWKLYDFTNPGVKPALFSQNTLSSAGFTMTITATRDGVPTPFTLVAVDAEASEPAEITTLTTSGTAWRTIEFFRNSSQTSNPVQGCGTKTATLSLTYGDAPETGQNPVLATDAENSITVSTMMNRTKIGGMAVAFGIFSPIDRGDLPPSYGQAKHGLKFITQNSCNFNPPFPSIAQSSNLMLGSVPGDADGSGVSDDNASGVDEEAASSFHLYDGSGSYDLALAVTNTTGSPSSLRGWFDFNADGAFSDEEAASVQVPAGARMATLTWSNLPSHLNCTSKGFAFRFRLASSGSDVQAPDGYAHDGEVEDYLVPDSVLLKPFNHLPPEKLSGCAGSNLKLGSSAQAESYLWSNGAATDSISVSTSGLYWVEAIKYGCSNRDSFMVSFAPALQLDFGFQQELCSARSVQFNSDLSSATSFQWNFGDGQVDSQSQNPRKVYGQFGNYDVKLVASNESGCTDSISKEITIDNLFDNGLIHNVDTTICLGDSLQIRTQRDISNFCWSASTGTAPQEPDAYVKPSISTTYSLTAEITGDNLIVNGDFSQGNTGFTSEYQYASSGFAAGVFSVGSNISAWHSGMSPCNDHTTGNGNMMMINGADKKGVVVWSETVNVQPNTNYVFYTWLQHITTVNPARLQFSINGVRLGNIFQANQKSCVWERFFSNWNSGDNTTATISIVNMNEEYSGNDFALDDIFFGDIVTKTDSFTVVVAGLCDSVKIEGPRKICDADAVNYSVYKSPNCTQQYYLDVDENFADIISRTDTSIRLRFTQNGSTTIKIAYNNDCKIAADSLEVTVSFSPRAIKLGPDVVTCADTSLQLDAGEGFVSYVWQDGSTASTLVASSPGNYSVTATNLCGEQLTDAISIVQTVQKPFAVTPADAAACKGDYVEFTASGGTAYSWSPASNFSSPDAPSGKAIVDQTQTFTVHITDSICKRDTTLTVAVTALEKALITLTKSNDVNCTNDSAVLVASGGVTYTWSPDVNISRRGANSITVKPYESTTYVVHGVDESGCAGEDSVAVIFTKEGDQKLFVPTAFTPNGDGLNDLFKPIFVGPSVHYNFRVYNRWGQLLFRSKTPGAGWDGRFNGNLQKADVYVFYVAAEGGCNGRFEQKGTFALIR